MPLWCRRVGCGVAFHKAGQAVLHHQSTCVCESLGSIYGPCSIQQACTVFFTPVSHRSFPWRKVSNTQHVLSVLKEDGLLANLVFVVVRAARSEGLKMASWENANVVHIGPGFEATASATTTGSTKSKTKVLFFLCCIRPGSIKCVSPLQIYVAYML